VENKMNIPLVSIIVPVYNGQKTIAKCIESLLKAEYPRKEIIIIDNGSTDATLKIVSRYPVKLIIEKRRGAYIARNTGIAHARGEIILFTDADCIVDKNWIKCIVRNYRDERIWGVGGSILPYTRPHAPYTPRTLIEKYSISSHFFAFPVGKTINKVIELSRKPGVLHSGCFYTANASFRKEALMKVGNFDESFFSGGDIDICYRILNKGGKLIFDPDAKVYHIPRDNILSLIRQFFKYGLATAQLVKKHFHNKRYILLGHYVKIVKNIAIFLVRLITVLFKKGDKLFYLLYPIIDNVVIFSLILGKIVGSFRYKVIVL